MAQLITTIYIQLIRSGANQSQGNFLSDTLPNPSLCCYNQSVNKGAQ